jgi:hypothetical protein
MTKQSYRYAGLQNIKQTGLPVEQCVARLHRLAYAEERLMLLQAVQIVERPEWDLKLLLGRLQYEDVQHADGLKQRLTELRVSKNKAYKAPDDEGLKLVFDEAMHTASTPELLAALTQLFKPALLQAYRHYLAQTNGLADYPTVRLLKMIIAEEEEILLLLQAAYRHLVDTPEKEAEATAWAAQLGHLLAAAGGLDGTGPAQPEALRPRRATHPYKVSRTLARDETFTRIWDFIHVDNQNVAERLSQMMATRLAEITAAEGLAYVLWETEDQPWSFYTDISRHLWDEIRHTLFGEIATEDVFQERQTMPLRAFDEASIVQMTPLEMYAMLGIGVEAAMMKYPPGKREEFEFCRDVARYPLMATFQDFDWADEVLHVNIARRQLKEWFAGNTEELIKLAQYGVELRGSVRHRRPPSALPDPSRKLRELEAAE